jgi:hypothetical protein
MDPMQEEARSVRFHRPAVDPMQAPHDSTAGR